MDHVVRWSGREARALREALRMTGRDFANRLGVAPRTVTKWDTGGSAVHPYSECQAALDTLYGRATAEEKARFASLLEANQNPRHPEDGAGDIQQNVVEGAPLIVPISASAAEVYGFRRPSLDDDVDPALVLHWDAMLRVLSAHENLFGSQPVYQIASGEYGVIRTQRKRVSKAAATELLRVEARWAEFCSWTAENSGERGQAAWWLDRALGLADRAGALPTAAYIRMRQAQHAADRRDADLVLALAGSAAATPGLSERDRALCAVRQAHGHALRGDASNCVAAVATADRLLDRVGEFDAEDPDTIGAHAGPAYLAAHEAYCRLLLGDYHRAIAGFEAVLSAWPAAYRQDEALTRAWLALAYQSAGRPSEATAQGVQALSVAGGGRSARAPRALGRLQSRLGASADPVTIEFRDAYGLATRTS